MFKINRFFLFYLGVYYIQLCISMIIISKQIEIYKLECNSHNDIFFVSLCFSLMTFLEFYSISKFCFLLQIEGIVQLIPLKVCHYMFILGSIASAGTRFYGLAYMLCDGIFLAVFCFMKDESFSQVYHEYNFKIGMDVNIRNSFIVSQI
ncbi:hypothetical protein NGRA_1893 [Nosema granulosis]|uniref:Uncharacterized protein n=1 Tax=Nosema granulosis TaxID=83296 RepID=A0A9P6KYQ6_9MICR|nr:hypothetical protein NGRA_1893 [Nosema granulosis]